MLPPLCRAGQLLATILTGTFPTYGLQLPRVLTDRASNFFDSCRSMAGAGGVPICPAISRADSPVLFR